VADPVSWFLIRSGWKVVSADGREVGRVDEVTGDEDSDIFDGLAVATTALGRPHYVPAEQVGRIEDGVVHLTLTAEEVERLGEYLEPATSAEIEPGGGRLAGGLRDLESRFVDPPQTRPHRVNVWRRLGFLLHRLGRR
jgi:hypothetical protein